MKLALRQLKEDDESFGYKAGDVFVVDLEYDWDSEKVECIAKIAITNEGAGHSFYKSQLQSVDNDLVLKLLEEKPTKPGG